MIDQPFEAFLTHAVSTASVEKIQNSKSFLVAEFL